MVSCPHGWPLACKKGEGIKLAILLRAKERDAGQLNEFGHDHDINDRRLLRTADSLRDYKGSSDYERD